MCRLQQPKYNTSNLIKTPSPSADLYPAFTFKYLQQGKYDLINNKAQKDKKLILLDKLRMLSQQSWSNLDKQGKETGTEYLNRNVVNKNLPDDSFLNQIKQYVVFRTTKKGKNTARIVGYRYEKICYILWIDWDLTLYNHGS